MKKIWKKSIKLGLYVLLLTGILAGCSGEESESTGASKNDSGYVTDAKLKIWGSQEDSEMYNELVESFKKSHPEAKDWKIDYGVVTNADSQTEILKDVSAAADIFSYPSDQIQSLQEANALYRITKNKEAIVDSNIETSIQAATVDGELYGYPISSATYFMYYDKSLYTEEEVKNLNTMMEKDLGKGIVNFSMDISNGWYNSSFFQGVGNRIFGEDGQDPTKFDFNNARGKMAADYMIDLVENPKFSKQEEAVVLKSLESRKLGATFSGIWNANAIKEALGDDFGATILPKITLENGEEVQLKGMLNFNLLGINAHTKYPAEAMLLAEYFATDKNALETRMEMRPGPLTNKEMAARIQADKEEVALAALSAQTEHTVVQTSIPQIANFWTPAGAFGEGIIDGSINKKNVQENLDKFAESVLTKVGE